MGDVTITITDGGAAIQVPQNQVQLVIGPSAGGTAYQIVATQNPNTLLSSFVGGALPEAAALACRNGGTVLAIRTAINAIGTASAVQGPYLLPTAPTAKDFATVTTAGASTSVVTVSLDGTIGAFDDYYVVLKVVTGGTRGTAGIIFQLSLDAGRSFGPNLSLGTATTFAITNTGITLNFGAGTLVTGEMWRFATKGPTWTDGAVQSALTLAQQSPYAKAGGWGSTHIVGSPAGSTFGNMTGGVPGSDSTTIQGYLTTLETGKIFTRSFISARDAIVPATFGGAGETEATWIASLAADYASQSSKRICAGAGHYNMPSAFSSSVAGTPKYRRPISWAAAALTVGVPPQRNIGRVKDGAVPQIAIDAANDQYDGFVYHDETNNSGLTVARFMTCKSYPRAGGLYIDEPNLMAPAGSDFSIMPFGLVMDVACTIVYFRALQLVNADIRLNPNGTIFESEAQQIESDLRGALNAGMTGMTSGTPGVSVNRITNVRATSSVPITVTIQGRAYVINVPIGIGFQSPFAA